MRVSLRAAGLCLLALMLALTLANAGCKGEAPDEEVAAPSPRTPSATTPDAPNGPDGAGMKIALVMKTMSNPFFQKMEEGAQRKADELGVELLVTSPARETDIDEQANKVRNMIQAGVDAILIAPAGSKEIVPVLVEAKEAGVITINLDNRVDAEAAEASGLELDAYVGADNEEGGYLAGKHLAELVGDGAVVTMLEGIPSADNAIARREGFERAMAEHSGIELLAPFQSGHWEQEEAHSIMANLLQTHPELAGLFCANDMMALGAMRAIEDAGMAGQVTVLSYDNLPEVQDALKSGALAGTIEQHPDLMGAVGVETAVKIHAGEKVEVEHLVPLELSTPESVQ